MKIFKLFFPLVLLILVGCTKIFRKNDNSLTSVEVHDLLLKIKTSNGADRAKHIKAINNAGQSAVTFLIQELSNPDPDIQESSAALLGIIGDKRAVEPLIKALEGGIKRKFIAAWSLSKLHDVQAIPPLIKTLEDESYENRKYAVRALIGFGKEAVMPLIKIIKHPNPNVRSGAARALGDISSKEAIDPILSIINDENEDVVISASWAIGKVGDERAVEPLIKLLTHKNKTIRINVARSLGIIGSKTSTPALENLLNKDEEFVVREWAARALENITGKRYKYRDSKGNMVEPYNLYR